MQADLYRFDEEEDLSQLDSTASRARLQDKEINDKETLRLYELYLEHKVWRSQGTQTIEHLPRCTLPSLHQILPGLFLGNQSAAYSRNLLIEKNIKAVAACGIYLEQPMKDIVRYYAIDIFDHEGQVVGHLFAPTTKFIRQALQQGEGVLVHCFAGISRSSTFVIAYLMRYHGMTFVQADLHIRKIREVSCPNEGFVRQLKEYQRELQGSEFKGSVT